MARKASQVGPHIHSLIEDARIDLCTGCPGGKGGRE